MPLTWDNIDTAPRRWNSEGPLTHSPALPGKGLGMKPTLTSSAPCIEHTGSDKTYQTKAASELILAGHEVAHWAWITPMCDSPRCLEPSHLRVQEPVTLAYPWGVCIYCGRSGYQKDHLLPRRWTGDVKRHFTVTVPSCGTCNSTLSDTLTWSITERRAICHARLRRKYAKCLRSKDFTPAEMDEFGDGLRGYIEEEAEKKKAVLAMLAWPTDPSFDLRALERSGIDNPYAIGLILPDHIDIDEYVRNVVA